MISATCLADDFFNPPPLNPELPPWMQDNSNQNGTKPDQAAPAPQPGSEQQQPSQPPAPDSSTVAPDGSFSGSEDEEGDGGGFDFEGSSGGDSGAASGKSSFQILDQTQKDKAAQDCVGWGSSFLGAKAYASEMLCRNELDQQVESSRDKAVNYADHTEKEVLRSVIRGKISREKSKGFHLDFSQLKDSLTMAAKTGCRCLE